MSKWRLASYDLACMQHLPLEGEMDTQGDAEEEAGRKYLELNRFSGSEGLVHERVRVFVIRPDATWYQYIRVY